MGSTRDIIHSLKKRKRVFLRRKLFFYLLFFVVLIVFFDWFSGSGYLNVKDIEISGELTIKREDIILNIQKTLSGKYLFLFSKSNMFVLPYISIKDNLLSSFPKIEKVSVRISGRNVIKVAIFERRPIGIWCMTEEKKRDQCFYLDKNGYIFSEAPNLSGNSFYYFFGGNFSNPITHYYTDGLIFARLFFMLQELKSMGFSPYGLSLIPDEEYRIILKGGGEIYLNEKQTLETSLDNINSMLRNGAISTSTDFLNNLNHLDLRFGNRIHFDLKN